MAGAISATGVDGLATGHGLQVSDLIDVHWTDPVDGTHKCRRGITVDVSNENDIEFDDVPAAEGDALPDTDTAVVVGLQVEIDTDFAGNNVEMVACRITQRAIADFRAVAASVVAVKLAAAEAWHWISGQNIANPLADELVDVVRVSNGSIATATVELGVLYQSV